MKTQQDIAARYEARVAYAPTLVGGDRVQLCRYEAQGWAVVGGEVLAREGEGRILVLLDCSGHRVRLDARGVQVAVLVRRGQEAWSLVPPGFEGGWA